MDVILAVDSLVAPLTGIGRYAYELVQRLPQHPLVERLRFFSFGLWGDGAALGQLVTTSPRTSEVPAAPRSSLRSRLAGNRLAVRAYHAL